MFAYLVGFFVGILSVNKNNSNNDKQNDDEYNDIDYMMVDIAKFEEIIAKCRVIQNKKEIYCSESCNELENLNNINPEIKKIILKLNRRKDLNKDEIKAIITNV